MSSFFNNEENDLLTECLETTSMNELNDLYEHLPLDKEFNLYKIINDMKWTESEDVVHQRDSLQLRLNAVKTQIERVTNEI
jgi:hypothetical protein